MGHHSLGDSMRSAFVTIAIVAAASFSVAAAEAPSGRYSGQLNGTTTTLSLESQGATISGTYSEPALTLSVRGTRAGERVSLELYEPTLNIAFAQFSGTSRGGQLVGTLQLSPETGLSGDPVSVVFKREGAGAASSTSRSTSTTPRSQEQSASTSLDRRVIGTWVNEDIINSGGGAGGFGSFTTIMTMEFSANGQIRQTTRSVGGGGDWSSDSGERVDFTGQWEARNGKLFVKGMGLTSFTEAASYSFSGDYLVTNGPQGRLIWQRR